MWGALFAATTPAITVSGCQRRKEGMELIELACQKHPDVTTAEALVPLPPQTRG
ncbi:MAG: hypothetical protein ACYTAS_11235 [Planctomycetota bacterium]|jgi:hypothetical protein